MIDPASICFLTTYEQIPCKSFRMLSNHLFLINVYFFGFAFLTTMREVCFARMQTPMTAHHFLSLLHSFP
jgi:hypothetical protein